MRTYNVIFTTVSPSSVNDEVRHSCDLPNGWGVLDVKDGFWVNEDDKPTKGMDIKEFILPHRILRLSVR